LKTTHSQATHDLISAYSKLRAADSSNDKYLKYPPSIPFIGNRYFEAQSRILVYASAENLTYALENPSSGINSLAENEQRNRHYHYFTYRNDDRKRYPEIHMRPIKVGGLLLVAKYIADSKFPGIFSNNRYDFLDQICCGNIGKFSLATTTNKDYAGDIRHLIDSVPYIINDIEVLQPELIILPLTSLRALSKSDASIAKQLVNNLKHIDHIGIYQVNQRVINGAITSWIKKQPLRSPIVQFSWFNEWNDQIEPKMDMQKYLEWLSFLLAQ